MLWTRHLRTSPQSQCLQILWHLEICRHCWGLEKDSESNEHLTFKNTHMRGINNQHRRVTSRKVQIDNFLFSTSTLMHNSCPDSWYMWPLRRVLKSSGRLGLLQNFVTQTRKCLLPRSRRCSWQGYRDLKKIVRSNDQAKCSTFEHIKALGDLQLGETSRRIDQN